MDASWMTVQVTVKVDCYFAPRVLFNHLSGIEIEINEIIITGLRLITITF